MLLWVWGNILSYNMMFKSKNISFWLRIGDKNAKTPIWGRTLLIAPNDSLISIYRASSMQGSSILIRNIIVPTLSFFYVRLQRIKMKAYAIYMICTRPSLARISRVSKNFAHKFYTVNWGESEQMGRIGTCVFFLFRVFKLV